MEGASPPPWTPLLGLGFEIPSGRAGRGGWCHGPDWLKAPSPRCWCSRTNHGWGALPGWSTAPPRPPAFAQAAPHCLGRGVRPFQESDPTLGTSLAGAALPSCTSVYHTQAGREQQGHRASCSPEEQGQEPLSFCGTRAWREARVTPQGPLPAPHPAHPALP